MKINSILILFAGALAAVSVSKANSATAKANDSVSVIYQDPDNFTDAKDSHTNFTSTSSLEELKTYVQRIAAPLIPTGSKLTVTFLDLDFAGLIRPDKDNIRVMTDVTPPRAHLKFELADSAGKVIKEGERRLIDMNYQLNIQARIQSDPLVYDKQLLRDWLEKEFQKRN